MLAILAAIDFFIILLFKPDSQVNLVVLGFLLISLHLAFGDVLVGVWNRRRNP